MNVITSSVKFERIAKSDRLHLKTCAGSPNLCMDSKNWPWCCHLKHTDRGDTDWSFHLAFHYVFLCKATKRYFTKSERDELQCSLASSPIHINHCLYLQLYKWRGCYIFAFSISCIYVDCGFRI